MRRRDAERLSEEELLDSALYRLRVDGRVVVMRLNRSVN